MRTVREPNRSPFRRDTRTRGIVVASGDFTVSAKNEARATPTVELIGFPRVERAAQQDIRRADWPQSMSFHIRSLEKAEDPERASRC